jgi:hypothetical protein
MTKSENFIVNTQVVTMSFFGLTFLKVQWLVIMLAVVAADDASVQETIGKEEILHFKNSTLQQHYRKTVGVSSSNCCVLVLPEVVTSFILNSWNLAESLNVTGYRSFVIVPDCTCDYVQCMMSADEQAAYVTY